MKMTTANILTGHTTTFKDYSNFISLKDFNNNIEMFLFDHKKDFTPTELVLFKRLTKYATKVKGIANASVRTLLNGVKEKDFKLGASESTFHRMRRKAIKLGILEVKSTNRTNGSQSSNLWIFQRYDKNKIVEVSNTIDTPTIQEELPKTAVHQQKDFRRLTPLKTSILSKASTILNINKRKEITLDASYIQDKDFKKFIKEASNFYDANMIHEYIKATKQQTKKYKKVVYNSYLNSGVHFHNDLMEVEREITQNVEKMSIEAFKQTIFSIRQRKNQKNKIKNPVGLYATILKELVRKATFLDRYQRFIG